MDLDTFHINRICSILTIAIHISQIFALFYRQIKSVQLKIGWSNGMVQIGDVFHFSYFFIFDENF